MSSHPAVANPSISKSAAKKKSKKASAKAPAVPSQNASFAAGAGGRGAATTAAGEIPLDLAFDADLPPLDPAHYSLPPAGSDGVYDQTYYDEVEIPPGGLAGINGAVGFGAVGGGGFSVPLPAFNYDTPLFSSAQGGQAGQNGGLPASSFGGLSNHFNVNISNEDIIHAANELYRRMADPNFAAEDAYWSQLPPHIRAFVRDQLPTAGPNGVAANDPRSGQQTMYEMAQKIITAASESMGLGGNVNNLPVNSLLPPVNGRMYPGQGIADELGFHRHPDAEEDYDDEEEYDVEEPEYATVNGDLPAKSGKKKNKKKKKTGAGDPPPAALPPPAMKAAPRPQPPPAHTQPVQHPPPPAPIQQQAPGQTQPPPSSRAAGKQPMSQAPPASNTATRSARAAGKAPASAAPAHNHNHANHSTAPAKSAAKGKAPAPAVPAKVWTQSSVEDRENIRDFWLGLTESERRDLLQIEKDSVLRRMKEQHRHSCQCSVCGRKKINIEAELNSLYGQYEEDLRQYANLQRAALQGQHPPPPGAGPFPGSVEVDQSGQIIKYDHRAPDPRPPEDLDDGASEDYDDDEEYDDEEDLDDDELGSDEADVGDDVEDPANLPPASRGARTKAPPRSAAPRPEGSDDFLGFGSMFASIKGGVLTVADELVKNDGGKFLEMMEQLAVVRSMREEQVVRELQGDDEEEDYDDEPLTEQERIEEGKRMFQIFAARLFEQRVLQAYKEKMAKQREEALLRELEMEDDAKRAKEEKKAKEAQKKKDKKKLQKQKADEEKATKDAALAAEQQAAKARAEEVERERLRKQEEERARREAVRKAAEEEKQRQATERRRRQQEEKEREEEAARKKREREEKVRKEKEAREKELKDRERREKEEKAAKDKAEKERIAKDKAEKAERDRLAAEKAEQERQVKLEEERQARALEEAARKEQEAADQAKAVAQRKAAADKAVADKAAADKLAALLPSQPSSSKAAPIAPVPVRASKSGDSKTTAQVGSAAPFENGPLPTGPPGLGLNGPLRPPSGSARPPSASFLPAPGMSMPPMSRAVPIGQPSLSIAPGYRAPPFASPSPAIGSTSQGLAGPSISPGSIRGFADQPFDQPRTAPVVGQGWPKSRVLHEDLGSLSSAPLDAPGARLVSDPNNRRTSEHGFGAGSGSLFSTSSPMAPPGLMGASSAPGAPAPGVIGQPPSVSETSTTRLRSPTRNAGESSLLGPSALLSEDDEIVQPTSSSQSKYSVPSGFSFPRPSDTRWSAGIAGMGFGGPSPSDEKAGPPGLSSISSGVGGGMWGGSLGLGGIGSHSSHASHAPGGPDRRTSAHTSPSGPPGLGSLGSRSSSFGGSLGSMAISGISGFTPAPGAPGPPGPPGPPGAPGQSAAAAFGAAPGSTPVGAPMSNGPSGGVGGAGAFGSLTSSFGNMGLYGRTAAPGFGHQSGSGSGSGR